MLGSGSYLAEVVVEPSGSPSQRFTALFSRKPMGGFSLFTALSTSGKPIFRARDPLRAELAPELDFFHGDVSLSHSVLTEFYEGIRPLILLDDDPTKPQPLVKERHGDGRPRTLFVPLGSGSITHIREYDWEGHAFRITIEGTGFSAEVTLRQYEISQ